MKSLIFVSLLAFQSSFALTGVMSSKVFGKQQVGFDVQKLETQPEVLVPQVLIDHDTGDMACSLKLVFSKALLQTYQFRNLKIQEYQDLVFFGPQFDILDSAQCQSQALPRQVQTPLQAARHGYGRFVLRERTGGFETVRLVLTLSFPAVQVQADLEPLAKDVYELRKTKLMDPSVLKAHFSVVEERTYSNGSGPSWSYLEHGEVELR